MISKIKSKKKNEESKGGIFSYLINISKSIGNYLFQHEDDAMDDANKCKHITLTFRSNKIF
jgi:hypothetical protein